MYHFLFLMNQIFNHKIPLPHKAQIIIQYFNNDNSKLIFPKISNQMFNDYLKEIAEIFEIKKNLTHHVSRKTFASTVLLYNDVPM